jgi:hypothetical protein
MASIMEYKRIPERLSRIESAETAIKAIIPLDILESHKRELIGVCIWKITEAGGKWNVRFRSEKALSNTQNLRHEHVYERKHLIDRLISGETVDSVIRDAIACIVTQDEHLALSRQTSSGWNRYRGAEIKVYDLEESRWVIL